MNALDLDALWRLAQPLLLATPRLLAMLLVAPLLPAAVVPLLPRNTIVLALALCAYPFVATHLPEPSPSTLGWVALIAKEVLVGSLIGFAVGVPIWALQAAGGLFDLQAGLSNAMLFDPFGGHSGGPYAALMAMLATTLFIACGGLYVVVTLVLESFRLWPPGAFEPAIGPLFSAQGLASLADVVQLIVRVAVPVVLLLAVVELGIGLVNRAVPQLNVFYFSQPIKALLVALMLSLYLAYLLDFLQGQVTSLSTLLPRLGRMLGL